MNEVLIFKDGSFYNNDQDREEATIRGEDFRALMDLCFAHADRFSLHRSGWPGANVGALEQALRPFRLGEYRSYRAIHMSYEKKIWEKCYLYPATEETKAILLRHIPHLFGRETSPAPEGHAAYLEKKYAAFYKAADAAGDKFLNYLDEHRARTGCEPDHKALVAIEKEAYRETNALWQKLFDPKDYYSAMEDPCFFRGDEMFFETITHERVCSVHVFSDEFGARLRELGEWLDWSKHVRLPLFSLKSAKKLIWYDAKA